MLPLAQALEAIELMEHSGTVVLGWEGWLRYPGGKLGHSSRHQGTAGDRPLIASSEYAWLKQTMQESHAAHASNPEVLGSELLFCLTPGA